MKPSVLNDITAVYLQAHTQGLGFAAFRLPNTMQVKLIVGKVKRSLQEGEKAYIFHAFYPQSKPYFITQSNVIHSNELNKEVFINNKQNSTTKKQFIKLVEKIAKQTRLGEYKKIVAARVLAINKPESFNPVSFFKILCKQYKGAFVSLTYIPKAGLWIGASPEVLVSEGKSKLITYSLAGTKAIDDNTGWLAKEKEEQQIVTDFIHTKLRKITGNKITLKGPVNYEAGRLKHLLSIFTIKNNDVSLWQQVAKVLHPTPAVGGMPQHKAVKFVLANEPFKREFYAGYLGPVNWNRQTNLFVNLRCMQVTDKKLLFYAGCGITADSDPEKEWLESERKIEILKSLITKLD